MSDKRRKQHRSGFTLLELVVVLAILAVVTTLAIRSLDGLEDQSRYEKNTREFEALSEAVLGSPDDRAADGSRTVSGFVADMGRLPRAVADGSGNLTLAELWVNPGVTPAEKLRFQYTVRQADGGTAVIVVATVESAFEDLQVYVPGGWRGSYLRLPIGATTWVDGWGNPMLSPATGAADPNGTGYPRLRTNVDLPVTTVIEGINGVRHLGANGRFDPADTGYDRDGFLEFSDNMFKATLTVQVDIVQGTPPVTPITATDTVTVCLFGPDPSNPARILVKKPDVVSSPLTDNSTTVQFLTSSNLTAGPRVVRAYFNLPGNSAATAGDKSAVRQITLRPGANFVNLTIDR